MEKSISQLIQATTIDNDTLVEVSVTDTSTTSGYGSRKTTVGEVRNEVVLTGAEYDALTTEEKMNGKSYYIRDGVSTNGVIQPIIYSDDEREVGVWRDGKPLYQITYTTTISSNVSSTQIDITALNVDTAVDMYGTLNGQVAIKPIPNIDDSSTSNNYALDIINNNTTLRLTKGSGYFIEGTLYITLRYTKTTDTAGSGTWTPSGVPAVHYSTDEQVIGTWIDGSTLYQRTFTGLSVATTGTAWVQFPTIDASTWAEIIDASIYRTGLSGVMLKIPLAESGISDDGNHPMVTVVSSDFNSTITTAIFTYTKTTS